MTTNRKNNKWQLLNFQYRQPNRTTMARTLNVALLLGHPLQKILLYNDAFYGKFISPATIKRT